MWFRSSDVAEGTASDDPPLVIPNGLVRDENILPVGDTSRDKGGYYVDSIRRGIGESLNLPVTGCRYGYLKRRPYVGPHLYLTYDYGRSGYTSQLARWLDIEGKLVALAHDGYHVGSEVYDFCHNDSSFKIYFVSIITRNLTSYFPSIGMRKLVMILLTISLWHINSISSKKPTLRFLLYNIILCRSYILYYIILLYTTQYCNERVDEDENQNRQPGIVLS